MARRHSVARSSHPRDYTWARGNFAATGLSAGSQGGTLFSTTERSTMVRLRGEVLVFIDASSAPGKLVDISMGIIKVPAGTGTTVLVDPFGEPSASWIWYDVCHLGYEEYVTDVIDSPLITACRVKIDSKAMRKLFNEEEIQFVVTNTTLATASSVNIAAGVRLLGYRVIPGMRASGY